MAVDESRWTHYLDSLGGVLVKRLLPLDFLQCKSLCLPIFGEEIDNKVEEFQEKGIATITHRGHLGIGGW